MKIDIISSQKEKTAEWALNMLCIHWRQYLLFQILNKAHDLKSQFGGRGILASTREINLFRSSTSVELIELFDGLSNQL